MFKGTGPWYARYRPGYPPELIAWLAEAAGLEGRGRVLDLGAGPGLLAVPLAAYAAEVVAVDVEPEMFEQFDAPNIRTVLARAEDVDASWGRFELVTIGRAFHWMDAAILERLPTDCVALVGDTHEHSEAQTALLDLARGLLGERPVMKQPDVRYEDALRTSPFSDVTVRSFEVERTWTTEQLIGYAYSTSFASLARLGDKRGEFERLVRERLKPFYRERVPVDALLGRA